MDINAPSDRGEPSERLTERQRACLSLVAEGLTSKAIGRRLGLSPSTVDNHIRAAVERLGLPGRGAAARWLLRAESAAPIDPVATLSPLVRPRQRSAYALPPLGGEPNMLSARRRFFHIVQIALLGTMVLAALTVSIAGIVHLFSR